MIHLLIGMNSHGDGLIFDLRLTCGQSGKVCFYILLDYIP